MKTAYKNFIIFDGVTLCMLYKYIFLLKKKRRFLGASFLYWLMVYAAEMCIVCKINDRLFHFVFKSRLL